MRQPIQPATTSPLHALVAAVPPEALRELVLRLLLDGAAVTAPAAAIATPAPRRAGRRGRPVGKPRGRPRKAAVTPDDRKAARAARHAERKRQRRAAERAARQAKAADAIPATTNAEVTAAAVNDNGSPSTKKTEAARLWAHAAKIDAKSPWRPVADEFELNRQTTLDAYRLHTLPPGMTITVFDP
jgi:hypothetical protein